MSENNKVIPFTNTKKKKNRKICDYFYKSTVYIYISRKGERYELSAEYTDDTIPEEEIIEFLNNTFDELEKKVKFLEIKSEDYYDVEISLGYYQNINPRKGTKYECFTENMSERALATYLLIFLEIENYKRSY